MRKITFFLFLIAIIFLCFNNSLLLANTPVNLELKSIRFKKDSSKLIMEPSIILGDNPSVCSGVTSASITYSSPTGNPVRYSIEFDAAAIGIGFSNVSNQNLPSNTIPLQIPNNSNSGTYNANIIVYDNSGVPSELLSFAIVITGLPSVNKPSNVAVCNDGLTSAISFSGSAVNGTTYNWSNSNTAIGLGSNGIGTIPGFTATNTTSQPLVSTITIIPEAANCEGTPKTFSITVNPTPSVNAPNNIVVCNGAQNSAISLSGSAVNGTTYNWSNSNTAIGLGSNGTGTIPGFTATNTTSQPLVSTITIIPEAANCEGTPKTFSITVNPTPSVTVPNNIVVCNGAQTSAISLSGSAVNGTTYNWSNSNTAIGLRSNGTGIIPGFTGTNTISQPLVSTITIIPEAANCEGTSETYTITVNPTPNVQKPNDVVLCAGSSSSLISLEGSNVNGTSYSWTNSNPAIGLSASGMGDIPIFTALNNSTEIISAEITIIPEANNCEGVSEKFTITINPYPEVALIESQIYCKGLLTNEIPLVGNIYGITYDISGGTSIGLTNRNGVSSIPAFTPLTGTATITVTPRTTTCVGDPISYSISVNPTPNIAVSPASQAICSGETTSINISSTTPGSSFGWTIFEILPPGSITGATGGTGNRIEQTLTNTSNAPSTIKYRVIPVSNNCEGSPAIVTITVNPTPDFTVINPESVCFPAEVDLTSTEIITNSSSGLSFTYWQNEAATISLQNPEKAGAGTFYIKGTTSSGCEIIKSVTVIENPLPQLTSALQVPGFCSETLFSYQFTSDIPETEFSWSRPAISGISTPPNSGSGDINEVLVNTTTKPIEIVYEVTLISPEGCINNTQIKTTITPTPILSSALDAGSICSGVPFEYAPTSATGSTVFQWSRAAVDGISNSATSGTGNISETLINTTNQTLGVTYRFTLASNNCQNPQIYNVTVTVTPSPDTQVMVAKGGETPVENEIEICPGESIYLFSNTSFPNDANIPSSIINSSFNNANQGWVTEQQNNNRRWNLTNSGTLAESTCSYVFVGPNWWNFEYRCNDINFQSNDNSQFFLVNSNINSGNFNNVNLISPTFNTQNYNSLELNFWHVYKDGGGGNPDDRGYLEYRTQQNNGNWNGWQELDNYRSTEGEANNFIQRTYAINNLIGFGNVQIRFRYHNANNDYYWAIDNVTITGNGAVAPQVQWTSDVGEWTSNEEDPENIIPSQTTIYTATYTDPETGCPGSDSVKVIVRQPPSATITANYCGDSRFIELVSDNEFSSYSWESGGEILGTGRTLEVEIASTYSLTVVDAFGCTGSGSINISDELIVNGDFEDGATGFYTDYRNRTGTGNLYPEGDFAVDSNARDYHNDFNGSDHTTGNGNFMIINGDPGTGRVIWRQTIENIQPNTNYYFNAWGTNINPKTPARLQFRVNGIATGSVADLRGIPVGEWVKFYSNPFWNSGNATSAVLEIINLETIRDGNDFGIDDISFGTLEPVVFSIDPDNNSPLCSGGTLELYANLTGGREPIEFTWTNAEGVVISNEENPIIENVSEEDSGIYTLSVTDGYGCSPTIATSTVTIFSKSVVNAGKDFSVCADAGEIPLEGLITGSVSTGTWVGGKGTFTPNANSLNAVYTPSPDEILNGFVTLTLTSAVPEDSDNPCQQISDEITIQINSSPLLTIDKTDLSCFGSDDGTATVNISENTGTAPFTYLWSDGQMTKTATNLAIGDHEVIVTDSKGCSAVASITLLQPAPLEIISTNTTSPICFGGSEGTATIEVTGGFIPDVTLPNYLFYLSDSEGNEISRIENSESNIFIVEGLISGNYTFSISIANGCTSTSTGVIIIQPDPITIEAGSDINFDQCGILTTTLSANIPQANETGLWTVDDSSGVIIEPTNPNSEFRGNPLTSYVLTWTITNDVECVISDTINISFPESCSTLDFDGEDDYVHFENNYNMSGAFSVEVWIKPHSINGIKTLLSKRDADNLNANGFDLILNNGSPVFRINGTSINTNFKVNTSRWHHIAGTFDGNTAKLFVDGIELKSVPTTSPNANQFPFLIGALYKQSTPSQPVNFFHGWMEEVRIWNKAITQDQLRFMMNQRLRDNNNVRGLEIPIDVPGDLKWNNLIGYYKMLKVENGFLIGETTTSINGKLINITTNQENTAPLPYILYTENNGDWYANSTWQLPEILNDKVITQRNVWESPNSLGIDKKTKIDWNIVKLSKNVKNPATPNNANRISLLGLISEGGVFDMMGDGNFEGNELNISHYLKLDGIIDLNGESQLVQKGGSIIEGDGYIERDQQGTASSYNYNYWSSPVLPNFGASHYKVGEVLFDGSTRGTSTYKNINFGNAYTHADVALTSPIRISNYWIYAFRNRTANDYSSWEHISSDKIGLLPGEGYTMKGSQDISTSEAQNKNIDQNYTFKGFPNNGLISLTVGTGQNYLIGNPYPSALDTKKFILDNLNSADVSEATNTKNVFNGVVYFWDHFAGKTHILKEYVGGYAAINLLMEGVPAASVDDRINNSNPSLRGSKKPMRYIPVAQGFFINTVLDPELSGNYSVNGGQVIFNNDQREYVREVGNNPNSQFLKPEILNKGEGEIDKRDKIRLDFKSPLGYNRQILVGVDDATTANFDIGYDAPLMDYNLEDMYWIIDQKEFMIQGVPHFNKNQILPLGIRIENEGEIEISINELKFINDETNIYLKDNIDSTYHNLKETSFKTSLEKGEYFDRFEIVFHNNIIIVEIPPVIDLPIKDSDLKIYHFYTLNDLLIINPLEIKIDKIILYNMLGQVLEEHNLRSTDKQINLPLRDFNSAVYIIKVFSEQGIINKKIIMRD